MPAALISTLQHAARDPKLRRRLLAAATALYLLYYLDGVRRPRLHRGRGGREEVERLQRIVDRCPSLARVYWPTIFAPSPLGQFAVLAFKECPDGTVSDALGLMSASQCELCPPGHFCYGNRRNQTTPPRPCPAGRFNPSVGKRDADECELWCAARHAHAARALPAGLAALTPVRRRRWIAVPRAPLARTRAALSARRACRARPAASA